MRTVSIRHWNLWPEHLAENSETSNQQQETNIPHPAAGERSQHNGRSYNRELAKSALSHAAEKIGMVITYIAS